MSEETTTQKTGNDHTRGTPYPNFKGPGTLTYTTIKNPLLSQKNKQ